MESQIRAVDEVDLVRLALLMLTVGTIVLSVTLLVFYWRSERLMHVLPLALSYVWLALVVTLRGWDLLAFEPALWNCVGAFTLGDIGLTILLLRPFQRNTP